VGPNEQLAVGNAALASTLPAPGTQPVPVPYPHLAAAGLASAPTSKVLVKGKETASALARARRASGDEPGTAKGMMSSRSMGAAEAPTQATRGVVPTQRVVVVPAPEAPAAAPTEVQAQAPQQAPPKKKPSPE